MRVMLAGDIMLGRLVKERIRFHGIEWPLGGIAPLLRQADLAVGNLECALTSSMRRWGRPKAFYFAGPPEGANAVRDAGFHLVSLANNHALDYGEEGLRDTIRLLRENDIAFAGAGEDLAEAQAPVFLRRGEMTFGMVAYCDHQEDFAAGEGQAGIAYLDMRDEDATIAEFRAGLERLRKGDADWPILSLHWGPNMVHRPSERFQRLARAAIDDGYGIVFGHSAHVFHGIEVRRGKPILYATGDLVDDYMVHDHFRNDLQMLFELDIEGPRLRSVRLYPVGIEHGRTLPLHGGDPRFEFLAERATRLSAELGTVVAREGDQLVIPVR